MKSGTGGRRGGRGLGKPGVKKEIEIENVDKKRKKNGRKKRVKLQKKGKKTWRKKINLAY